MIGFIVLFISQSILAQMTGTNSPTHQQETLQKQIDSNRKDVNSAGTSPNSPSNPTKVDVSSWGIDSQTQFEISNHLFGYSTIIESGQTLKGVKITGFVNVAFYNAETLTETGRSQGRLVFGLEIPIYNFTNRLGAWTGLGLTLGDRQGFYLDLGVDYRIMSWFKIQAGANWNSKYGGLAPQVSLGFVW